MGKKACRQRHWGPWASCVFSLSKRQSDTSKESLKAKSSRILPAGFRTLFLSLHSLDSPVWSPACQMKTWGGGCKDKADSFTPRWMVWQCSQVPCSPCNSKWTLVGTEDSCSSEGVASAAWGKGSSSIEEGSLRRDLLPTQHWHLFAISWMKWGRKGGKEGRVGGRALSPFF